MGIESLISKAEQNKTPLFDAVKKYIDDGVISFHVPGHKQGRGIQEFRDFIGENALKMDVNGMEDLDYINNPTGVISKSEKLMAQAFGAKDAFFLVNGTTSGVQAMILSSCEPGNKIIIPRNAHKSTIGGIILSGAIPVYIQPEINKELGIATGITIEAVENAIKQNPDTKAVFIINPTYYGAASNLKLITELANSHDMTVLVDEAHGSHMCFHDHFPLTAMEAGADISAASIHKTAGSLTQSSVLLLGKSTISPDKIRKVLNLTYTSSASYLLMCSLDVARKQLALNGTELFEKTLHLARWARNEINKIDGLYAFGKETINSKGCYDFDESKLGINVSGLDFTGYQVEAILRKEYNIQIEMSDLYNILAIISIGDSMEQVAPLIAAMQDISSKSHIKRFKSFVIIPPNPEMIISPRQAFYSPKKIVSLEESSGHIAGEMIMAYPPGIPVISLGERITKDIVDYIKILKREKCQLQGTSDPYIDYIKVLGN